MTKWSWFISPLNVNMIYPNPNTSLLHTEPQLDMIQGVMPLGEIQRPSIFSPGPCVHLLPLRGDPKRTPKPLV